MPIPINGSPRAPRRQTPVLVAAGVAVALALSACSSTGAEEGAPVSGGQTAEQEAQAGADEAQAGGDEAQAGADVAVSDGAVSEAAEPAPADADDAPGGGDLGANSPADGVFAGVPVVDGEISHDRSGTLTNGETDYRDIGVDTGLSWNEASDLAREQLLGAGLTEQAWGSSDKDRNQVNVRAVYERGEVVIQLEVTADGNVAYDARETPTGSFAEKELVCGALRTVPVELQGVVTMMPMTTGEPVTGEDLDLTFAFAEGLKDRVPADVSAALAELRAAAEQAVGLPAEQTGPGTEVADALAAANAALGDAQGPVCSG